MASEATTVVDHIVLFKLRPDASEDEMNRFHDGINSLSAIPGVISITLGGTFVEEWMQDRRDGTTHCLSVRLESKDALRAYQDHPLHVKVIGECIVPVMVSCVAVDYESTVVLGGGRS